MSSAGHAIISGGSSGIGLALASQLASLGWQLTLVARDQHRLQQAAAILDKLRLEESQKIRVYSADVTNEDRITAVLREAIHTQGVPELVITSAGEVIPGMLADLATQDYERVMRSNYLGTVNVIKAVYPFLEPVKQGHFVLIASGAALAGISGYSAYSPAKFAVRGLAESLRMELRPKGIRVSIVYPPDTDTPQLAQENRTKPEETRMITSRGGVMSAEDVASAILKGIGQKKFVITPGVQMTLYHALLNLLAPCFRLYFDTLIHGMKK